MTRERHAVRVLVVEDSPVVREFLLHILNAEPGIHVVGTAKNGEEAIEFARKQKPDLITMDIHMPKVDGFEATRRIMETVPTPIVIVSGSSTTEDIATTFHALEAGALVVIRRPMGIGHPDFEKTAGELRNTVKLMSEVKVIKRWPKPAVRHEQADRREPVATFISQPGTRIIADAQIIAIGASTGGPVVLQKIFSELPRDLGAPVVVVQHIASGFLDGFVEWLNGTSHLPVHVANQGDQLLPGNVYVAPDGLQFGPEETGRVQLSSAAAEHGMCPSVSFLFRSVAKVYGRRSIGLLLTGMGRDGSEEPKLLKDLGAVTIAQDRDSSVVYGMPGEAVALGAATYILSPEKIIEALKSLIRRNERG